MLMFSATICIVPPAAVALLLWILFRMRARRDEPFDSENFSWRSYPLARLLDPTDFDFVRRQGIAEERIRTLRSNRRKLFRRCLSGLTRDFRRVHQELTLVLMHSGHDRPQLAFTLAARKVAFYRNVLVVEAALALHVCGCDRMPTIDLLLEPLKEVEAQLRR